MTEVFGVYADLVVYVVVLVFVLWGASLAFFPRYAVWAAHMRGRADLARAQNEQQIQIAEARGRFEAAELNKKAAIIEAEAVAEQIDRIGKNLGTHELYLRWQWIKMMEETDNTTIYVPTEANLPILEARRKV